MFLDSLAMMPSRWGWCSIDDGIYEHFAPLELADESAPGATFRGKELYHGRAARTGPVPLVPVDRDAAWAD